jgi:DNA-directed RNA polymerase specialized sigma24 family protein
MAKKKRSRETPKKKREDRPAKSDTSKKPGRAKDPGGAAPEPAAPGAPAKRPGDDGDVLAALAATADPEERYVLATAELAAHVEAIERLSSIRADAVAAAYASAGSVRVLAQRLGVSPSRVHQLIQESKARAADGRER